MSDPKIPGVPEVPDVPQVPSVPQVPGIPEVPGAPIPGNPQVPGVSDAPGAPQAPTYSAPPPPAFSAPTVLPPSPVAPAAGQQNGYATAAYPAANQYQVPPVRKQPVLSLLAMILGVIGVLGSPIAFFPFGGILAIFFPLAAVVLGFLGRTKEPQARGLWLTGLVTGFIGAGIALLSILAWSIFFGTSSY